MATRVQYGTAFVLLLALAMGAPKALSFTPVFPEETSDTLRQSGGLVPVIHWEPEFPFKVAAADEAIFRLSVEETSITLSQAQPCRNLSYTLGFHGEGVLYQLYEQPDLHVSLEISDADGVTTWTALAQSVEATLATIEQQGYSPYKGEIPQKAKGWVYFDDSLSAEEVREEFETRTLRWRAKVVGGSDQIDGIRSLLARFARRNARRFNFVGAKEVGAVDLCSYVTPQGEGEFSVRLRAIFFPSQTWDSLGADITDLVVVYSDPIRVRVVE